MNPTAIYSKSGKGVQEASGKTSVLKRADRSVLSAIDGRATLAGVAEKVGKPFDAAFEQLISQLDRDGFIREVSAGTPLAPATGRPGAAKPAAKAGASGGGEELDFTISIPVSPSKPAVPPPPPPIDPKVKARQESERKAQEDNMTRARREAEERAQREKDRLKLEAEARIRAETEAKLRQESESRGRADAEAKLRAEAEAKVKAAREAAVRLAAETKAKAEAELQAKIEAERKAREEAERARKEAEEKARREAEELRQRLEEERKAREEAERKAREEAERARKEAEEKARREAEELRQRLEEERKAREEAERKAKEEERRRREEEERRAREEKERQAREEAQRKQREAEERKAREAEEARREKEAEERRAREAEERSAREAEERRARQAQERKEAEERARREEEERERARERAEAAPKAGAVQGGDNFADSLLSDLDSFTQGGEEDERKAKEAEERKSREAEKAREEEKAREAEKAREDAGRKAKEEGKRKRRAEEERREREAKEREEAARREQQERERESARHAPLADGDDIGVSEDDLDMSDVRQDQKKVAKESRKAARAREREQRQQAREARERARERDRERDREEQRSAAASASYSRPRRRGKWGKPVALMLFVLLIAALGVLHLLPISTTEYENAATLALGRPVKLGTGHISLITGLQLKFDNVVAGDAKIASVRAYPEIGSLFGEHKAFSRIELEGVSLPQADLGDVLYGAAKADNFSVSRVVASKVNLSGPLKLPELEADLAFGPQGRMTSGRIGGPDGLHSKIAHKGDDIQFDTVASSFSVPFAPDLNLSTFAMKGSANRRGMNIESWGGGTLDGAISGTATVRWGSEWRIDGVVTVRNINAAVFAPALLSDGRAEGTAKFSVHGADPLDFKQHGRIEGRFSVNKGVLGSFDLSRAIQTGGRQAGGSTPFTEMTGEVLYERGMVALRNVSFGAGKLNAGASADIAASGALSGRIVADVHASSQTLRAIVNIGGTAKEPQVKN